MKQILLSVLALLFISPAVSYAQTATPACTLPSQVQNVVLTYPSCPGGVGSTCDTTKARCTWDALTGVTSYTVTFTNVDTNTVASSQTVPATTTALDFAVTQGQTYKCSVAGVNSCGTGTAGTYSLLCAANGLNTTTPTPTPTGTTVTTTSNPPTTTTSTTTTSSLPKTGNDLPLLIGGVIGTGLLLAGGVLLFL